MEITEVRVKLVEGGRQEKLKAFCSITIDDAFVIRDLKIIDGSKGLFVAMPSRKLTARCPKCGAKNQVRSNYCSECGYSLPLERSLRGRDGRLKLHADIAHPINSHCRETIQARVLDDYHLECEAAQQPGYEPKTLDDFEDLGGDDYRTSGDRLGEERRAAEGGGALRGRATDAPQGGEAGLPDRGRAGERRRPPRSGDLREALSPAGDSPASRKRSPKPPDGMGDARAHSVGDGFDSGTGVEDDGFDAGLTDDRDGRREARGGRVGDDGGPAATARRRPHESRREGAVGIPEQPVERRGEEPDDNFDVGIF